MEEKDGERHIIPTDGVARRFHIIASQDDRIHVELYSAHMKDIRLAKDGSIRISLRDVSPAFAHAVVSTHSGEDKIREDMERQTILERLGWQFIRIRGSEYYRDPDKTMDRVVAELTDDGIEPEEAAVMQDTGGRDTELLQRVKQRAYAIIHQDDENAPNLNERTVEAALDPKNDVIGAVVEKPEELELPKADHVLESSDEGTPEVTSVVEMKSESVPEADIPETVEMPAVVLKPVQETVVKVRKNNLEPEQMTILDMQNDKPEQMMFPGMEEPAPDAEDIIALLEITGTQYVDKRANGGSLWIIGGYELSETVRKAKALGFTFHFKKKADGQPEINPAGGQNNRPLNLYVEMR